MGINCIRSFCDTANISYAILAVCLGALFNIMGMHREWVCIVLSKAMHCEHCSSNDIPSTPRSCNRMLSEDIVAPGWMFCDKLW